MVGEIQGCLVRIAAGGVGALRAGEAAGDLLEGWQPDWLVVTGVAGALAPDLALGDVVVATTITSSEATVACPPHPVPPPPSRTGVMLSADRVLVTAGEKQEAHNRPPLPDLVEMETAGAIVVASELGVRWSAVRAVSDTAAESLPFDFNLYRDEEGDLPNWPIALAALSQPRKIPALIQLARNVNLAAESAAAFLCSWLERAGRQSTRSG
jgi:adenosylhomocysteine nucleosidase